MTYRHYNPDSDAPFWAQEEEESGRGEIGIEEWEAEKICNEVESLLKLITFKVRMEHEEVIIKKRKKEHQEASSGSSANGLEYLGIKHLNDNKDSEASRFKILWAGTPEAAGVQNKYEVTAAVKVERISSHQRYWWMLSSENPNLDFLLDNIGEDTEHWVSKELLIFVYVEMPSEKKFVRAEMAAPQQKAAAAKKS